MGEFAVRNMLSWFKKINKRKCFCILLVVYIVELKKHGQTYIKFANEYVYTVDRDTCSSAAQKKAHSAFPWQRF